MLKRFRAFTSGRGKPSSFSLREVAVDLTAETFAVALRSWATLRPLGPEQRRAWLFTVARRLHSRYARRARVERRAVARLGIQVPALDSDDLA
jgi:RNA polymerase sigma-70 factor (ECF subfamily)